MSGRSSSTPSTSAMLMGLSAGAIGSIWGVGASGSGGADACAMMERSGGEGSTGGVRGESFDDQSIQGWPVPVGGVGTDVGC